MDIIGYMNAFNKVGKYLLLTILVINLVTVANATASTNITSALKSLCQLSQVFLGAAVMVLIVLAGVTYAIGQVLGAETRARATVWATAMITGALIGAIIYIVTPAIMSALLSGTSVKTGTGGNPCNF